MSIRLQARAILNMLHPLTGSRATGVLNAQATTSQVVPKNTYFFPIVNGALLMDQPFKTTSEVTVGAVATDLPIQSNIGGLHHNLDASTTWVTDASLPDLTTSVLTTKTAPTGGTSGAIKYGKIYHDAQTGQAGEELLRAMAGTGPAALLSWNSATPSDGTASGQDTGRTRLGRGQKLYALNWNLLLCASTMRTGIERLNTMTDLVDQAAPYFTDRSKNDDGERVATRTFGLVVNQMIVRQLTQGVWVGAIALTSELVLQKQDYNTDWAAFTGARVVQFYPEDLPLSQLDLIDQTVTIPQA